MTHNSQKKIIIIDDDPADIDIFKGYMERISDWKIELFCFHDWNDAAKEIGKINYDILFLDYLLDQDTGLSVIQKIRSKGDDRPIIVLTGYEEINLAAKIFRHGADDYLTKSSLNEIVLRKSIINMYYRYQLKQEKNRLEKKLKISQKMESIGALAGGIAHDFNNILFPIMGYAEMMIADLPKEDSNRKNISEILKAAGRAKELVHQILSFSQEHEEELHPLKLNLVIKEVIKLIRATLPTTIEILQKIDPSCPMILGDPTLIHQVVLNLCTNAFHAMKHSGGTLSIELTSVAIPDSGSNMQNLSLASGKYTCLHIQDTGHGIDPEILPCIFDPYFTTKKFPEGTGLGLSIVYGIIKKLHGEITVESTPGKGTGFHLFFPCVKNEKIEPALVNQHATVKGRNERILLVDDDEPILRMLGRLLGAQGYQVTECSSSLNALKLFNEQIENFDLVITDQTMPEMTGMEFSKQLIKQRPTLPIILCTGYSELVNESEANRSGIKKFLMKPVLTSDMTSAIRTLLSERGKNEVW